MTTSTSTTTSTSAPTVPAPTPVSAPTPVTAPTPVPNPSVPIPEQLKNIDIDQILKKVQKDPKLQQTVSNLQKTIIVNMSR